MELTDILNQCVFQWASLRADQVDVATLAAEFDARFDWAKDYDFTRLGRGCANQLARSGSKIVSSEFSSSLDTVLNAAKAKLAPGFVLTTMTSPLIVELNG